jgi:hypothetical protein
MDYSKHQVLWTGCTTCGFDYIIRPQEVSGVGRLVARATNQPRRWEGTCDGCGSSIECDEAELGATVIPLASPRQL